MSLASLEYARQADEERERDLSELADLLNLHISLPGASFTLWISPIRTKRRGPSVFREDPDHECIVLEDYYFWPVGYEWRDGSLSFHVGLYWPAERKERHNLGGRLV